MTTTEYRIKAVSMFHFLSFIDGWRFQEDDESAKTYTILMGIIGEDPFGDAFAPLMEKQIRGRKVIIKKFQGLAEHKRKNKKITQHPEIEAINKCDLVFICSSEKEYISEILASIHNQNILTVADTPGFLEKGGIINFVIEKNKVCFEVNNAAAKRAKLDIRSKLLRLAKRVVSQEDMEGKTKAQSDSQVILALNSTSDYSMGNR